MCHAEGPAAPLPAGVVCDTLRIPLPGGAALPAVLLRSGAAGGPAVLLVHDMFGATPFYQQLGGRLAAAGYRVLLPELFHREGPLPALTREAAYARWRQFDERRALEELQAALDWLAAQGGAAASGRLGTMGFCLGGTLVLDLAALRRDLATVCFYGFPAAGAHTHARSAPAPLELADRLQGPILGFWGDQDEPVGFANVVRLRDELLRHGVDFECVVYPGVGHAFMGAPIVAPTAASEAAAADAWTRTLAFYARHLRQGAG
ncbi:MAG TPA: dienelactone hydrolase family protein [Chloroflexota bacterium]|nr:dienelactone hydrolase family protein [Chloroflexota bacterium]